MFQEINKKKNEMNTQRKKPLISVIISCFNYAHFLPEALNSILNQTYINWECIIVDDGSTDNTKEVAQSYVQKDRRFKYIYQKNQGLSMARNTGVENATGEYIQFLDADDFISFEKFVIQLKFFNLNSSADIAYSEYLCFDNENRNKTWTYSRVELGSDAGYDFATNWEKDLSIPIHCFLYKKSCFDLWEGFDTTLIYGKEDWDLHIKFALCNAKYVFTKGIMAFYRVSATSMVRNTDKMTQGKMKLFKKYIFKKNTPTKIRFVLMQRYLNTTHIGIIANFISLFLQRLYIIMKILISKI